jgi:type VI protein secretion system component Hcp
MTFRIQKKWRWLVALAAVFVPGIVTGALSLPFTFSAGSPIRASEVNANFEALRAQVDALSGAPVRPAVGTLTIAGVASQVPIRKFTQSVTVSFSAGVPSGVPTVSDVEVVLDVGDSAPQIGQALSAGKTLATADVTLGSFALHLKNVVLDHATVGPAQADHAQETLSLAYASVDWSWQVGTAAKRVVSYNRQTNVGGSHGVTSFKYGYFAAGVDADAAYIPISGYSHDISCLSGPCTHGALAVQKSIGSETMDELGAATSAATGLDVDVEWFLAAGTASNSVTLAKSFVAAVQLSTKDDGTLSESAGFGYAQITWKAGTTAAGWDVTAGTGI